MSDQVQVGDRTPDEPGAVPPDEEPGDESATTPADAGDAGPRPVPYRAVVRPPQQSPEGGQTAAAPADTRSFSDLWQEGAIAMGLMPSGFDGDVYLAVHRSGASLATTIDQLLAAAITKVGAAKVAGPLLHQLRRHPQSLARALTPIPQLLEVVALTLASAGVLTAFDLCAAALYRASGGTPSVDGSFKALGYWRNPKRGTAALVRIPASRAWLDGLLTAPELVRVEAARHALIHRHLARRHQIHALAAAPDGPVYEIWGEATVVVPQGPGLPGKELGWVDQLVAEALAFGEREVLACREALRQDGALPAPRSAPTPGGA